MIVFLPAHLTILHPPSSTSQNTSLGSPTSRTLSKLNLRNSIEHLSKPLPLIRLIHFDEREINNNERLSGQNSNTDD